MATEAAQVSLNLFFRPAPRAKYRISQ